MKPWLTKTGIRRLTSERWQSSQTLIPSGNGQLATLHRQDPFIKLPGQRVRLKLALDHKTPEKPHQKGKKSSFTLPTLFLPQVSTVLHGGGVPGPRVSPVGKREGKVDIKLPQHSGCFLGGPLKYCLMGITGKVS